MSHLHSVRVPATLICSALLIIVVLSATRTTYRIATGAQAAASNSYALAGCDSPAPAFAKAAPRHIPPSGPAPEP